MLFSFAIILLAGLAAGYLFEQIRLPALMGMLLAGILIGPYCMNLIGDAVLNISSDLRRIALIIILLRAGFGRKIEDLKKNGRPALLMCFVPAICEIFGMYLLAPYFFGLSKTDALLLGSVIAAVSPAVIVPHMIQIMEEKYGTKEGIPQMVLAGASADDIFVIVLFSSFLTLAQTGTVELSAFLRIPTSIVSGIAAGILCGWLLSWFFQTFTVSTAKKVMIFFSAAFLLYSAEDLFTGTFGFSGLIAVIAAGMVYAAKLPGQAVEVSSAFSHLWSAAQIFLFVLIGAAVDIRYAAAAGGKAVLLIALVLLFRSLGVLLSTAGTKLTKKERLFCVIAYLPKATVQAAIGAVPLSMGIACGNTILTIAVVSILFTAPLGAFLIDLTYKKLLIKE